MSTYAIGDIQGCFEPLQGLLKRLAFNPDRDQLWLVGDLVNRGPASLATLRFCYERRDNIACVLGNHDLHLLAVAHQHKAAKRKDTLREILQAPDREQLLNWLQTRPLMHQDTELDAVMVHAGIAPCWTLPEAITRAQEVERVLHSDQADAYFAAMYGNDPAGWDDNLSGPTRWRTITNYFTRMRLVRADHSLDLAYKGTLDAIPPGLYPWFRTPQRKAIAPRIVFGHWAALGGLRNQKGMFGLDTGCVWGKQLTAYCLEDERWVSYP
jgi:bis(5'-nucleosyl)-tetraphosphatase (symmetrical)